MKHEMTGLVLDAVREHMPIEVLRGLDAHAHAGGDVDMIVPPGRSREASLLAAQRALQHGCYVLGFRNLGYVCSISLVRPVENGPDDVLKLDFISGVAWRGIGLDEALANPFGEKWAAATFNWADPRARGALTFFQKIMAAGRLSPKEWERIRASGVDARYLAGLADCLRLPLSEAEAAGCGISAWRKWRLRAASCGVCGPISLGRWCARVFFAHMMTRLGLGLGSGLILGISGLDGSGKSTLVARLVRAQQNAGCPNAEVVHLLPRWIPMPHQILRRKITAANYTKPYSEAPVRSKANGFLRLAYYIVAFAVARAALALGSARGRQIIMDRSVVDFASDLTRARIPAGRLPPWLLRLIAPKGQLFFLDASPQVVVARKGELTLQKATQLQESYRDTARHLEAVVLTGDLAPMAVFSQLLHALSHQYVERIRLAR